MLVQTSSARDPGSPRTAAQPTVSGAGAPPGEGAGAAGKASQGEMSVIVVSQRHDQFTAVQELRAVRAACASVTRPLVPPPPPPPPPRCRRFAFGVGRCMLGRQDHSVFPQPCTGWTVSLRCKMPPVWMNVGLATEVNVTSQVIVLLAVRWSICAVSRVVPVATIA